MKNSFLNKILAILHNLFGHGNLESVNSDFDLLTEKGEMAVVVKKEAEQETIVGNNENQEKSNTQKEKSEEDNTHKVFRTEPKYEFDDETLKRIYETLREIKEFEEKTNKLRHIKFAKRDKVV